MITITTPRRSWVCHYLDILRYYFFFVFFSPFGGGIRRRRRREAGSCSSSKAPFVTTIISSRPNAAAARRRQRQRRQRNASESLRREEHAPNGGGKGGRDRERERIKWRNFFVPILFKSHTPNDEYEQEYLHNNNNNNINNMSRSKVLPLVVNYSKSAVDRTLFKSSSMSIRSSSSAFASTSSCSSSSSTNTRKTESSRCMDKREMSSLSNGGQGQGVDANWKPHQPVQSKRPSYLPEDTPHTKKWLDSDASKAPIDWINEVPPIGVNASKVNCHSPGACKERFGEGAALGAPATFYTLADTSVENPAKCKYCGLRFYSLEGSH